MSSLRHLWFDTRHLLGDEAGQVLLTELEALAAEARETILATGDRLAEVSLTLAQAFCRKAPAAWHVFGPDAFPRWAAIGEQLAGQDPPSRDGAVAYFTIEPQAVSDLGLDQTEEWVAIGREVLGVSRRLGAQFFQASAPLLADLPAPFGQRLRAWAEQGRRLLGCKGWKGEFLAVSYFSSAPAALPFLTPEEMAAWAKLGVLVQESGPWTFYTRLPDGFLHLSPTQREAFLLNVHEAAAHSATAAQEIFFSLPPTLHELTPELQSFYLSALAPVIRLDPQPVPALLPLLGPIAKAVQLDQQPRLRETLLDLAQTFPAGIPALIRTLPRAYEETGQHELAGLLEWLGKGLAIAQDNAEAGIAYFALESRTSLNVLQQASPGIDLEEVQELLRKYIQMLTGSTVGIRRQEFFSYPLPLEESPEYGEDLPLPGRIEVFETYEDNFRLYRGLAALQAGRREFGTYTFSLSTLWPDLPATIRQIMHEDATPMGGLAEYFRCFPHPDILEALFLLVETQRIQDHIRTTYRGLSTDMDWLQTLSLPSLLPVASLQSSIFSILNTEHWQLNTVYASATRAAEIYLQLLSSLVKARFQQDDASEFGSIFFDKLTGDALIDPDMEDDSPPPRGNDRDTRTCTRRRDR